MANSKYEYVRSYEIKDEVSDDNLIVIRIKSRDFLRFSEKALNLMNSCAFAILEEYPDIVFGYGFSDEYKKSKIYKRRASKILSLIVSSFTSMFVKRWKDYFSETNMSFPPSFQSRIIACKSTDIFQAYLAWRQNKWYDKHQLLFQQSGLNFKELPDIFRHGSCVLKIKVEVIVKYKNGIPIKRLRTKIKFFHPGNIASKSFWNKHLLLVKEVGSFQEEIDEVKPEYIKSFRLDKELEHSTWIVVRIDGWHFGKFSEDHEFEKPNDEQALNLMNSCAVAVLNEFRDITFSYGASDEYSFVLKKDSVLSEACKWDCVRYCVPLLLGIHKELENILPFERNEVPTVLRWEGYML